MWYNIGREDIIIPEFCPIFIDIALSKGEGKTHDGSPTVDRVNPEKGYVKGNIAVVSHLANTIKSCGTAEQHRRIADWIDEFNS